MAQTAVGDDGLSAPRADAPARPGGDAARPCAGARLPVLPLSQSQVALRLRARARVQTARPQALIAASERAPASPDMRQVEGPPQAEDRARARRQRPAP